MGKKVWHFINSGKCSASFNMALDEALLEWHSKGEIGPVLRFYEWEPATLSIGYFQMCRKEIDLDEVRKTRARFRHTANWRQRCLHEHELTYSVIVVEVIRICQKQSRKPTASFRAACLKGSVILGWMQFFSSSNRATERRFKKTKKCGVF